MILAIIFAVAISLKNHRFHNLILTHLTWVFIRYFCILKEVVESLSGRPVTLTKVAFQVFICSESRNALLWFCHFPRKRLLPRWLPLYWWWRLRSSVSPMKWWARPRWLSAMRVGWVGWPQCHRPPRKYWPSYPAVFNGYGYSTLHCKTLKITIHFTVVRVLYFRRQHWIPFSCTVLQITETAKVDYCYEKMLS